MTRLRLSSMALAVLAACGSGSSGGGSGTGPSQFTIGGTVAGLAAGTSVVLQNSGADNLTVSADGPFAFATKVAAGTAYAVTVATQPPHGSCRVDNGTGTASADVTNVSVVCAANAYAVGGTVAGLPAGGTVTLQDNGGDTVTVGNGAYVFPTRLASGGTYAVTASAPPAGWTCTVANASGTVADVDVGNVNVTCSNVTHTVGGAVNNLAAGQSLVLQNNLANDLTVTASGPFTFAAVVAHGSPYSVTVKTQPATQFCSVAGGSGTVTANVTTVAVSCVNTYTVGGTVTGLAAGSAVALRDTVAGNFANGPTDLTVSAGGAFTFPGRLQGGATYAVTVTTSPAGGTCSVVAGGSGTMGAANVTSVRVDCLGADAIAGQRWTPPLAAANGGTNGTAWADSATMVQHAYSNGTTMVELKSPRALSWMSGGAAQPPPASYAGFPSGAKYGAGPFSTSDQRYQAASNDAVLDQAGDILVCAIVKPAFDPVKDGYEKPIIAKGVGNGGDDIPASGWVLMQMHESFCFHYEITDGTTTHQLMAFTPSYFADGDVTGHSVTPPNVANETGYLSPLNPGYVVVCGGRDGVNTVVAVNNAQQTIIQKAPLAGWGAGPFHLDAGTSYPLTIGGYSTTTAPAGVVTPWGPHAFDGLVYETAVWHEAATAANIQAKFAAVQGLPVDAYYARNRESLFQGGSDGGLHGQWRGAPRLDLSKGLLFGLQGWNRVSFWMPGDATEGYPMVFAAGEDFTLPAWTQTGGATAAVDAAVKVPGDSGKSAQKLTLPAGSSLAIVIDNPAANPNCVSPATCSSVPMPSDASPTRTYAAWDRAGPIQGQLWIRVASASSGTLRIRYDKPNPATSTSDHYDIDLSTLTAGQWKRVWLSGNSSAAGPGGLLTTDGTSGGNLHIENPGSSAVNVYLWGLDLTQVGGGGDAAYAAVDLGPASYDFLAGIESPGRGGAGDVTDFSRSPYEVLRLAPVGTSTGGIGYCLSVDAAPAAGLSWTANMQNPRTALTWWNTAADWASLYVNGTSDATNPNKLCFAVGGATPTTVCAAVPATWTPGSTHNVKGCVSAAGAMRLYNGDNDTVLANATGVTPSDLQGGYLLVGNSQRDLTTTTMSTQTPWHGYVSKVVACKDSGTISACQ